MWESNTILAPARSYRVVQQASGPLATDASTPWMSPRWCACSGGHGLRWHIPPGQDRSRKQLRWSPDREATPAELQSLAISRARRRVGACAVEATGRAGAAHQGRSRRAVSCSGMETGRRLQHNCRALLSRLHEWLLPVALARPARAVPIGATSCNDPQTGRNAEPFYHVLSAPHSVGPSFRRSFIGCTLLTAINACLSTPSLWLRTPRLRRCSATGESNRCAALVVANITKKWWATCHGSSGVLRPGHVAPLLKVTSPIPQGIPCIWGPGWSANRASLSCRDSCLLRLTTRGAFKVLICQMSSEHVESQRYRFSCDLRRRSTLMIHGGIAWRSTQRRDPHRRAVRAERRPDISRCGSSWLSTVDLFALEAAVRTLFPPDTVLPKRCSRRPPGDDRLADTPAPQMQEGHRLQRKSGSWATWDFPTATRSTAHATHRAELALRSGSIRCVRCTVIIRSYDTLAHLVNCPGCWIVADCVVTFAGSDQWDALGRFGRLQTVEYCVLVRPRARKIPQLYDMSYNWSAYNRILTVHAKGPRAAPPPPGNSAGPPPLSFRKNRPPLCFLHLKPIVLARCASTDPYLISMQSPIRIGSPIVAIVSMRVEALSRRCVHRRENVPLYWGCAGSAARAAGVLLAEIITADLKFLLAQTALCWPRGNVGYKRSPHQSTTTRREAAWCSLPKSRLQVGRLEG